MSNPLQHKYLAKLMGFTYTSEYKKEAENGVADALSRRDEEATINQMTVVQPMWITEVVESYKNHQFARAS